ncbi:hypothetical protein [Erythrobacter dokdonensis]|uniref:Uncharacterized protein n=1 Tax=Erythrobacter dokdonensis DSW-74 TaxID=1300349 RepID=A0A1A7BGH4_9SPHN|nr:hypothetical protein [Erythrobacter dokdonensis]OBV10517.1 hypothetical protein I603_2119 [Erythrobacter dokdonensis DSW-74]
MSIGLKNETAAAASDPESAFQDQCIERLVSPEAAMPLVGSLIGPAYGRSWVEG